MRKSTLLLLAIIPLIAAVLLVPVALADGPTPSGGPTGATVDRDASGPALNLETLQDLPLGASVPVCMVDEFNYAWSVDVSRVGPGQFEFVGTVANAAPYLWDATGTATVVGPGVVDTYWLAVNPQPDGCVTNSDSFEYFGSGDKNQSGTWTSYCFGDPLNSGDWTGTASRGACS